MHDANACGIDKHGCVLAACEFPSCTAKFKVRCACVQTNILFLENVLRHPEFLSGKATTSFIDRHPQLFHFASRGSPQSSLVLTYLAELVPPTAPLPRRTAACEVLSC